ncbi:MAG: glycogen synthase [Gemmatimonadota bacterium]|nr:MAG: glycogen synthase [Gemmatimonadota bacterium]
MSGRTIAFVASEITPFAKTGGLADVAGALPAYLRRAGHDVRAFLPLYSSIDVDSYDIEPVPSVSDVAVDMGERTYRFSLFETRLPGTDTPVYLVHCPLLFDRPSLYTGDADEPVRFALFSRAVLESCQRLGWSPEILHCNDWQTGLLPLYVKSLYAWDQLFRRTRTVLTIHNVGYQGMFPAKVLESCSLRPVEAQLDQAGLKAGHIGFLKTGLEYADAITTVSPTYAREIRTPEHGAGLHPLLERRKDVLTGILNGVDVDVWDPRTDPLLPSRYSAKSLWRKEPNKVHLLREVGLPYEKGVPVVGIVTRLAYQKGIELLQEALPPVLKSRDFRLVVLGSGELKYERFFAELQHDFPRRVCFYRGYHNELAHWIEAGSDMFLMPSKYEPCGLNQMYSLLYGTVPVVRKTGGLADTVQLYDPTTGEGNGIVFDHFTGQGAQWALEAALDLYEDRKTWKKLMIHGMSQDFSWERSGPAYLKVYDRALSRNEAEV